MKLRTLTTRLTNPRLGRRTTHLLTEGLRVTADTILQVVAVAGPLEQAPDQAQGPASTEAVAPDQGQQAAT